MRIANNVTPWIAAMLLVIAGCGGATPSSDQNAGDVSAGDSEGPQLFDSFDPELGLAEESVGDLDGMVERGVVRALVAYSLGQYFLDGATQRGATYEVLAAFENYLNAELGRRHVKVGVLIIPVQRDELIPALERGLGDLAAANLTITEGRLEKVDFSDPLVTEVRELVVTGPAAPWTLATVDDLSGRQLCVRRSSSYWESLAKLNDDFRERGLKPMEVVAAEEFLQDEDLLDMVNAGLIPMTVVDSHKAEFWAAIFDDIEVHQDLAVRSGGKISWAFRKNSPQLAEVVNAFVRKHKAGTLTGNVVLNRYLKESTWALNALSGEDRVRFEQTVSLFKEYGDRYDFDHLMLAALAYQESRIDQSVRSKAGAVGVMQLLPSTAADPNVGIPDISGLDNNIHAGTKYLSFLRDRYFSDAAMDPINQTLFSFAAYNAGPARVAQLREEASRTGLDPNVWFGSVEHVAARRVGREPVQYVSNIAKYYVAYRLASRHLEARGEWLAEETP
jgi:membrane-bound lytic murein transglycosylase MltF